jgi:hypothetical protein
VRDGETKLPLVGATVISVGSDIMAVTDSSGQCMVVVAPRRGGALVASCQGYMDQTLAGAWPAKPVRDTVVIDFLLYPNRPTPVVGGAIGADTKVATPGAKAPVAGLAKAESSQASGGSAVSNSPAGPRKVEAPHAAVQPSSVLIEAERTEAAEANLSSVVAVSVGSVEGVVSDARTGVPVPGARVAVDGTELAASTDSTGYYIIETVPVGMHKLLVTRAGYVNAYTVVRLVKDWAVTANLYLREPASRPPVLVK